MSSTARPPSGGSPFFAVATSEAFGALSRLELTAAAACVTYVERTQIGKRPPLSPPLRESAGATMAIDQATRANLELMRTLAGERRGSLLAAIDRTVTAAGSRLLAQRLAAPLTEPAAIARRLDAVRSFCRRHGCARRDCARACRRRPILPARCRGWRSPRRAARSCRASATALLAAGRSRPRGSDRCKERRPKSPRRCAPAGSPTAMLRPSLSAALADELPPFKRDGGFVREGYDTTLDETRALRDESRRVIAALQARYADDTGVRIAEDQAQQCARLFRRGDGAARREAAGARR